MEGKMDIAAEFKKGLIRSLGIAAGLAIIAGVVGVFADSLHVFSSGQAVSAAQINANFQKMVPIGTVVAWHKDKSGTPSIPNGWAECNGQTISDAESPYNGSTTPNLNNARPDPVGGSAGTYSKGVFLRGHTTSGQFQDDSLQSHFHRYGHVSAVIGPPGSILTGGGTLPHVLDNSTVPVSDGSNGTPRNASETRPVNWSVVWIIRIK